MILERSFHNEYRERPSGHLCVGIHVTVIHLKYTTVLHHCNSHCTLQFRNSLIVPQVDGVDMVVAMVFKWDRMVCG